MLKKVFLTSLISVLLVGLSLTFYTKPPICGCQQSRGFPLKYYAEKISFDINNPVACTTEELICPLTPFPIEIGKATLYPVRMMVNFMAYFFVLYFIFLVIPKRKTKGN